MMGQIFYHITQNHYSRLKNNISLETFILDYGAIKKYNNKNVNIILKISNTELEF